MGGTGKKNEHPGKDDGKSKKSPPASTENDDTEDGDFARVDALFPLPE